MTTKKKTSGRDPVEARLTVPLPSDPTEAANARSARQMAIPYGTLALCLCSALCLAMPTDTAARYKEEDARLGEVYRGVVARLKECKPDLVKPLRASERKWIDFRDAECAVEERIEPTALYKTRCLEQLTLQRIQTLEGVSAALDGAECAPPRPDKR